MGSRRVFMYSYVFHISFNGAACIAQEEDRTLMETGMTSIASIMLRDRIQAP